MATTISAVPQAVNLSLYAGDDFTLKITVTEAGMPVDMTKAVVESQIRATAAGPVLATFGVTQGDPASGTVFIHLTPANTEALPAKAVWDVQASFNSGANVTTLAAGTVTVTAQVTRDDSVALQPAALAGALRRRL
jgi:hypothetical protein